MQAMDAYAEATVGASMNARRQLRQAAVALQYLGAVN